MKKTMKQEFEELDFAIRVFVFELLKSIGLGKYFVDPNSERNNDG